MVSQRSYPNQALYCGSSYFCGDALYCIPTSSIPNKLLDHFQPLCVCVICGILSALIIAVALVSQRALGSSVHFMLSVFTLGVSCLVVSVVLGAVNSIWRFIGDAKTAKIGVLYGVLSGMFASLAQALTNKGLQHCEVGPGALIRNSEIPFVHMFGMVFLNETPGLVTLLGSTLVIVGSGIIALT